MTDRGDFILVDSTEVGTELAGILDAVETGHRRVRIVRDGKTVAEISPIAGRVLRPSENPNLKVTFSPDYDPSEGLWIDDEPAAPRDRLKLHPKLMGVQFNEDPMIPLEDWPEELR